MPLCPYSIEYKDGSILLNTIIQKHHCNILGICHGGLLTALADTCMYLMACHKVDVKRALTVDIIYKFYAVVKPDDYITLVSKVDYILDGRTYVLCSIIRDNNIVFLEGLNFNRSVQYQSYGMNTLTKTNHDVCLSLYIMFSII